MPNVNIYSQTVRVSWRLFRIFTAILIDTWEEAFLDKPSQNMNPYVRWELFIIGCVFLGITMSIDTQLHWLVLLPLMSIYLILTAIIGYEPLYFLIQRMGGYLHKHLSLRKLLSIPDRTATVK
ncbi:MAG: hypothetical protein LJE85_06580 [Gammaproteobacteria bacterium]|jgi:hypothetical protein|nr:hypothetical protein [Gammaproteobacteria bacterium]